MKSSSTLIRRISGPIPEKNQHWSMIEKILYNGKKLSKAGIGK